MERFDVVIVGARCAGSPLATALARAGLRVAVLDRANFPSETPSTHVIQPSGVGILERLGVLDEVLAAGAVPLDRLTLVNDDVRIDGHVDRQTFRAPALCVRRVTLDALLVEAAAAAGAHVRTATRMTGLIREGGRVVGVDTTAGVLRATLVVGADGRHSTVAACVGAAEYHVSPPGRMPVWAYYEGVSAGEGRLRLGRIGELGYLAGPTDSGLFMAGVATSIDAKDAFLAERERNFTAGVAAWPELADLLAGAKRVGPLRVLTEWHGYFRAASGPGWVLVGDAGHFKDFTPAQGISDALRQAERLGGAIEAGLGGGDLGIDDAMKRWWQWRDDDAYEMHWFATDIGMPGASSPLITRLMRDIAADKHATTQLMRVLDHQVRPAQLLTTGRLAKAAAGALRDRPAQIPATAKEIAVSLHEEIRRAVRRRRPSMSVS